MAGEFVGVKWVQVTLDVKSIALVHKLMCAGIYHARLSQAEFDNVRKGQEIFESIMLETNFYSPAELRMVLDSVGKLVTVSP